MCMYKRSSIGIHCLHCSIVYSLLSSSRQIPLISRHSYSKPRARTVPYRIDRYDCLICVMFFYSILFNSNRTCISSSFSPSVRQASCDIALNTDHHSCQRDVIYIYIYIGEIDRFLIGPCSLPPPSPRWATNDRTMQGISSQTISAIVFPVEQYSSRNYHFDRLANVSCLVSVYFRSRDVHNIVNLLFSSIADMTLVLVILSVAVWVTFLSGSSVHSYTGSEARSLQSTIYGPSCHRIALFIQCDLRWHARDVYCSHCKRKK